jgi:hypothetical protein
MKHILKDFMFDMLRQLFGFSKPRQGKLVLSRNALTRMHEHQLTIETLRDVFTYGEEDMPGRIIRKYSEYSVGLYYKLDQQSSKYVITTCWKGNH